MKDEIKEILEDMNYRPERAFIISADEKHLLLDYITNLQDKYKGAILIGKELNKENERLKQERQNIDNRNRNQKIANRKLQEEIESVRKNNRTRKSRCRKQTKKKNMYKTRNEKAIEYMNNYNELVVPDANIKSLILKEEYKKIIDILQGKSDE